MPIEVGEGSLIHDSVISYGRNIIGKNCIVLEKIILGYPMTEILVRNSALCGDKETDFQETPRDAAKRGEKTCFLWCE